MSGMKSAVDLVLKSLERKRNDISHFNKLFSAGNEKCKKLDLNELQLPRQRKPPKRISGPAVAFHHQTNEQYFLVEYYKVIDNASSKLTETGIKGQLISSHSIETCLLLGDVSTCQSCMPEISKNRRQSAHPTRNVSSAVCF
jgi:hypothetical protein